MCEILFKAKRENDGEWTEGYYVKNICYGVVMCHYMLTGSTTYDMDVNTGELHVEFDRTGIEPHTLCRYTGLTDKYNRKIWENDIVKWRFKRVWKEDYHVSQVVWDSFYSAFKISVRGGLAKLREDIEYEVIGNIFDNADLLEVE